MSRTATESPETFFHKRPTSACWSETQKLLQSMAKDQAPNVPMALFLPCLRKELKQDAASVIVFVCHRASIGCRAGHSWNSSDPRNGAADNLAGLTEVRRRAAEGRMGSTEKKGSKKKATKKKGRMGFA